MDLLPLIGAGIAFALIPVLIVLVGILIWKRWREESEMPEMTVPRWIGMGLGTVIIVGILGYSLFVHLGFLKDS